MHTQSNQNPITLYYIRHGETIFNTYDRVQGWSDTPLTDNGVSVAAKLGAGTKNIDFGSYYTGDLSRQIKTMEIALRHHQNSEVHVEEVELLREIFFGGFEGLDNSVMMNATALELGYPDAASLINALNNNKVTIVEFMDGMARADPKGQAENSLRVQQKMRNAMEYMADTARLRGVNNVMIVSSGISISLLIYDMVGSPSIIPPLENGSVTKIVSDGQKYYVTDVNDTSYIK